MGNGSRGVILDKEISTLDIDTISKAIDASLANFGQPTNMLVNHQMLSGYFNISAPTWYPNPEYSGTPWAVRFRLTKRDHVVAKLHTTLHKLKVLRKLSEQDMEDIVLKSVKRLKRAKWARQN